MEPYVHSRFFEAYMHGLPGELAVLDLQGKTEYFTLCSSLFVMEPEMAVAFVNALAGEPDLSRRPAAAQALVRCLNRAVESWPLELSVIQFAAGVFKDPRLKKRADVLEALRLGPDERNALASLPEDRHVAVLADVLKKNPHHLEAAELLLRLQPAETTGLLADFRCPKALQDAWNSHVFLQYARRGLYREALQAWPDVAVDARGAFTLVQAACSFGQAGESEMAGALFRKALQHDPSLVPVRLRLNALERPPAVQESTLERSVTICLFSWNKSTDLERTLRSLAASRLGRAKVRLLLNGCTDDSRQRAIGVRDAFGTTDFEVIDLPVNVGVAPARNWLLSLPETASSDYVVFADDDIEVPADWLIRMLSLAESDPAIGVVGGKAVFPAPHTGAGRLQYLYRVAGLTLPGLFKFSPGVPSERSFDTGLYSFVRPCLTVMGCLVLVRGAALRDVGAYDIRFNPSQVEDMDHDLSMALKGYKIMYHGGVTVIHHRNSGAVAQDNPASIWLNHLKMSCKRQKDAAALRTLTNALVAQAAS